MLKFTSKDQKIPQKTEKNSTIFTKQMKLLYKLYLENKIALKTIPRNALEKIRDSYQRIDLN